MKRILIVEDCFAFKGFLKLLLEKLPYEFDYCCSVEEVDMTICPTIRYNLIVCDYNLPGENGISFLTRLRKHGKLPCPIILMTANKYVEDECPDINDIVDGLMYKPMVGPQLKSYLKEFVGNRSIA